ncbi:hypothetical protein HMPREF3204_00472 [Gardnerella pickettii]|nr:hypothetical protein HMPREF3204_00472 [Gardnerella pickettii]
MNFRFLLFGTLFRATKCGCLQKADVYKKRMSTKAGNKKGPEQSLQAFVCWFIVT